MRVLQSGPFDVEVVEEVGRLPDACHRLRLAVLAGCSGHAFLLGMQDGVVRPPNGRAETGVRKPGGPKGVRGPKGSGANSGEEGPKGIRSRTRNGDAARLPDPVRSRPLSMI